MKIEKNTQTVFNESYFKLSSKKERTPKTMSKRNALINMEGTNIKKLKIDLDILKESIKKDNKEFDLVEHEVLKFALSSTKS